MAIKPENAYIAKVHKHLPRTLYRMKNSNSYTAGVPDTWYSGSNGDLWVEFKYLPTVPKRTAVDPLKLLSPLQVKWLNERFGEGRNVAVVIGCPLGGVLLTKKSWESPISAPNFHALIKSNADLAAWIVLKTASGNSEG